MVRNLDVARQRFEARELTDTCRIHHDPTGDENATLDPTTLELVGAADDETVSSDFPCLVRPAGERFAVENEAAISVPQFDILMRIADPKPELGDEVEIITSIEPMYEGRRFLVIGDQTSSIGFAQIIRVQDTLVSPHRA